MPAYLVRIAAVCGNLSIAAGARLMFGACVIAEVGPTSIREDSIFYGEFGSAHIPQPNTNIGKLRCPPNASFMWTKTVKRHQTGEQRRRCIVIQRCSNRVVGLATVVLLSQLAFTQSSNDTQSSNKVLGELVLAGAGDTEKNAGVWVDGQYLGYLKELKGSKKILLLPGGHDIVVKQDGYQDFSQRVAVQAGEKQTIAVKMTKDLRFQMPSTSSEIKFYVSPNRAAVFVDGQYAGHAGEFGGAGRGLLVAPGHRKITVSLTGYKSLDTEVDLAPNQKFEIKTDLIKEASPQTTIQ